MSDTYALPEAVLVNLASVLRREGLAELAEQLESLGPASGLSRKTAMRLVEAVEYAIEHDAAGSVWVKQPIAAARAELGEQQEGE